MTGRKTVGIVGGGPAGLVAAKTFLQTGRYEVTLFEQADRIGGIWALDQNSSGGLLSPLTPTNLSKFTVGFSDFSWTSAQNSSATGSIPMFPKAWQVNGYLEAYRKRYIPQSVIKLGHRVSKASRVCRPGNAAWTVIATNEQSQQQEYEFDYLVVASGFFSQPRPPQQSIPCIPVESGVSDVKILHSSEFRHISSLLPDPDFNDKTILVIGGGNSGGETAGNIAFQLSSAQNSPDSAVRKRYDGCKVIHVTPRPLYALPPFVSATSGGTSQAFVPIDLKLYDLSRRPPGPIVANAGQIPSEVRDIIHGAIQGMVGSDQPDLGSTTLVSSKGETRGAPYVVLSEVYSEFVRSGLIEVLGGRVTGLSTCTGGLMKANVTGSEASTEINGIAGVVYATGYTPAAALDFLDDSIKQALQYDPRYLRLPLILEQWQTASEEVPNLAFLGFYEGPYWPMMEMQAHLTIKRWGQPKWFSKPTYEDTDRLLGLRLAMQSRSLDVPQYWFGDYLGYMEELAAELKLKRNDRPFGERTGAVSPARYLSPQADSHEASTIMAEMAEVWEDCTIGGRFVARAVFKALHGKWQIERTIDSKAGGFPSGTLRGTASFYPRCPSGEPTVRSFDMELLYVEAGVFIPSAMQHIQMQASRGYVYRYKEETDQLSIWFVKPDNQFEVDYLFHNLSFVPPSEARKEGACVARADHLCVDDMYWTEYRLPIRGAALSDFQITHTVKGPSKDYVARTRYFRPSSKTICT